MGNLLYILAVILLIGWLVGFLGFGDAVGGFIHILLVLAVVFFLLRVIRGAWSGYKIKEDKLIVSYLFWFYIFTYKKQNLSVHFFQDKSYEYF